MVALATLGFGLSMVQGGFVDNQRLLNLASIEESSDGVSGTKG